MAFQDELLGRQLVKKKIITEEQLEEAMSIQRQRKEEGNRNLLGEILVELEYCTEEEIAKTLSDIFNVPYIRNEEITISEEVQDMLLPEIMEKYQAVPLWIEDDKLIVAMKNQKDIVAMENIQVMTGYKVKPVVVTNSVLQALIEMALNPTKDDINEIYERLGIHSETEEDLEVDDIDEDIIDADEDVDDRPVIELANFIFEQAAKVGASDIHINPHAKGVSVLYRIDGVLHKMIEPPRRLRSSLISRIKVMADMDIAERRKPQDGRITINVGGRTLDVRAASVPTQYGEKLTLRVVDRSTQTMTLSDLGFPPKDLEKFKKMAKLPYGFILVAGPTGSGKSTTLYATLIHVNDPGKHIITIEDPIERRVEGLNQIQVNPKAGLTFATGLRALMRNDPDIIMVGEIRDKETAQMAVESSLTGHLVFSTIHTNDAAGAVTRLVEMGIEPFLVASTLLGVIAQRLVRRLCNFCKQPVEYTREKILEMVPDFPLDAHEEVVTIYEPAGCDECHGTGYKGRTGVYELLVVSENIRDAILSKKHDSEIKQIAMSEGMTTMRQDALQKVKDGVTSLIEVARVVRD